MADSQPGASGIPGAVQQSEVIARCEPAWLACEASPQIRARYRLVDAQMALC
jgi:hypothetical protein